MMTKQKVKVNNEPSPLTLKILEHEDFGNVRVIYEDGKYLSCGADVAKALGYARPIEAVAKHCRYTLKRRIPHPQSPDKTIEMVFIPEGDVYRLITHSALPSAERFEKWLFDEVLPSLRKSTGLEAFEVFRMLDKEHQRKAMEKLRDSFVAPVRVDYIKANTIADKCVSTRYGYEKMLKKGDMTPDMLAERQRVLDDTVSLMTLKERYNMNISVSGVIYGGHGE
jgi:prophage antirepressor-like protein